MTDTNAASAAASAVVNDPDIAFSEEVIRVRRIKRKLKTKHIPRPEQDETFISGAMNYFYSTQRNQLSDWVTRNTLGKFLTFDVQFTHSNVIQPQDIRIHIRAKIQLYDDTNKKWKDLEDKNYSKYYQGKSSPASENHARFSVPAPFIKHCKVRMNEMDLITDNTEDESFKRHLEYMFLTTDAEKRRDAIDPKDNSYWYNLFTPQFGTFMTSYSRNKVGLKQTTVTHNEFILNADLIGIEDKLKANKGIMDYDVVLPCCLTARMEAIPGWQNFLCEIELADDSMLLVARKGHANGLGAALTATDVRIVYDLKHTYIYAYATETEKSEGMEVFAASQEEFFMADRAQLIKSESFAPTRTVRTVRWTIFRPTFCVFRPTPYSSSSRRQN